MFRRTHTTLLLGGIALLSGVSVRAQQPGLVLPPGSTQPTVTVRKAPSTEPDGPPAVRAQPAGPQTIPMAWQWNTRCFVNLGTAEPATLQETIRVTFGSGGRSSVQVTYRAKSPAGFPAGSFQGKKEVSYTIERPFTRVVRRGPRFVAQSTGPFKLVESDPSGYTLADLSTLGGIARGRQNMVMVVDEAFRGENVFVFNGDSLSFINAHYGDNSAHAFPAEIVLEPAK